VLPADPEEPKKFIELAGWKGVFAVEPAHSNKLICLGFAEIWAGREIEEHAMYAFRRQI